MQHQKFLRLAILLVAAAGTGSTVFAVEPAADVGAQATTFSIQTPPALAKLNGGLNAATAIAANDVWAVGGRTNGGTIIAHFNGTAWSLDAAPSGGAQLADVSSIASNNVWAAGTLRPSAGGSMTVAEHWNGKAWSIVPTPPLTGQDASFSSIVALTATDVWAAGTFIVSNTIEPLYEHWNGQTWTIVSGNTTRGFFVSKLSAVSAKDIWAVGSLLGSGGDQPFAEHWNGTAWKPVTVPTPGDGSSGTGGTLNSVVAVSSTDVWAVGSASLPLVGTNAITANPVQTLIEHWDGKAWSIVPSPNIGTVGVFQSNQLFGVGSISTNDVWAVGQFALPDGSGTHLALALRWDGSSWKIAPVPDISAHSSYSGVATLGPSVWIVGGGGFPGLTSGFGPLIAHSPSG